MPHLPAARDASIAHIDSLAPRDADAASLMAPAIGYADSPLALDAPSRRASLQKRVVVQEVQGIIPTYYNYDGPAAGTVVGIVLGSVAGFLLICWLFYSLAQLNAVGAAGGAHISGEEEVVIRRRRNSHSGRSRRSTRTEVREYSRSPRRREQVIVEERRPPPRPRSIVVEERVRVPGDDVVEVIEEHDEFRSRRGGSRRSGGGYRY